MRINQSKSLLLYFVGLSIFLFLGAGCSAVVSDGVPTTINPNIVRVKVGSVATVTVFLSKPREAATSLKFRIDDTEVVTSGQDKSEVAIQPGAGSVSFLIQGVKVGTSRVYAQIGEFSVSAGVVVTNK